MTVVTMLDSNNERTAQQYDVSYIVSYVVCKQDKQEIGHPLFLFHCHSRTRQSKIISFKLKTKSRLFLFKPRRGKKTRSQLSLALAACFCFRSQKVHVNCFCFSSQKLDVNCLIIFQRFNDYRFLDQKNITNTYSQLSTKFHGSSWNSVKSVTMSSLRGLGHITGIASTATSLRQTEQISTLIFG